MTSNLRIGYPHLPFDSTGQVVSDSYSTSYPHSNLVTGTRSKYAELATAKTGVNWIQYTVDNGQSNYLALLRANLLKQSGVTSIQVHRSSISWNYATTLSGCVLHLDATRGVTATSSNRVSSWVDLVSGHNFAQSTDADRPIWSRADNQANWIEYSEAFSGAYWSTSRATVTDNVTANPLDAATTAARLAPTATTGPHYIAPTTTPGPYLWNLSCRLSGYFKYDNYQYIWFGYDSTSDSAAVIDIQNGTISSTTGLTSSSITSVGSGWYRVELTFTNSGGASGLTKIAFGTAAAASGGVPSWTAAGTEKFYFYGIQLCDAGADTTYIATSNQYWARGINGKPCLYFLPTDYLTIATIPAALDITGDITIFAVSKRLGTVGTAQYFINCMTGSSSGYRFAIAGGAQQAIFETANGATSSLTATTATTQNSTEVLALARSTGTATHYLDNTSNGSGAVSNPSSASGTAISISNTSSTIQGYIAELIVFNRAVTGTERNNIYAYLRDKWQTTAEYTKHQFDSATLVGPHTEDWIETFTENSGANYWITTFYSLSSSKRPLGKLYLGQLFDPGRDPVYPFSIRRDAASMSVWDAAYYISLRWEGISDATRNSFIEKLARNKDISPILLYASSYDAHLDNHTLVHAWVSSLITENLTTDTNIISAEFEQAL